ncbi:hypothetical protein LTR56_009930 [Elasticomyces elasticus]|nr:hypothetical protein LTR56_009930 [Elasticomyces elasticus]KAK4933718.1 hypothetical protein LTR49_000183 [Elasticomyces elasticus]
MRSFTPATAVMVLSATHAVQAILPSGLQGPDQSGFINATVHTSNGGFSVCVSGLIPVQASATNYKINLDVPKNQTDTTELWLKLSTPGSTFARDAVTGTNNVSGTFNMAATLCVPADNLAPKEVHLATHGSPYNAQYWDFAPDYSYADIAAMHGHATFFYDRLGIGKSDRPDGTQIVQSPLGVEILHNLAVMLKSGAIGNNRFTKLVGVGHSFGSLFTTVAATKYPEAFDALVLTGFTSLDPATTTVTASTTAFFAAFNAAIASQNEPLSYDGVDNSFMVVDNPIGLQHAFLRTPFDPAILNLAAATKGSLSWGEPLSFTTSFTPLNFTGPVAVINGDADFALCNGNCTYPLDWTTATLDYLFPKAAKQGAYVAPRSGHGLNLQYAAAPAFEWLQQFLERSW